MTPEDVWVIGGGEHARVVMDAIRSRPDAWRLVGFVDPHPCPETESISVPRIGDDDTVLARDLGSCRFIIGVGALPRARLREEIVARYDAAGVRWATVVHARATVSPHSHLGPGAAVLAGAVVNVNAHVGDHAIVNTGAIVEHDVRIGAFTHVAPAAAIGGGARVGAHAYLGLGCRVRDHLVLGDGVLVGMGAVVVSAVGNGAAVVGIPARESGK